MSDDLIKRSDAIKAVSKVDDYGDGIGFEVRSHCLVELELVPSADRPSGEWIPCSKEGLALTELMRREGRKWYGYKCSDCNFIYNGNVLLEFNFCPNCGADMREREGE